MRSGGEEGGAGVVQLVASNVAAVAGAWPVDAHAAVRDGFARVVGGSAQSRVGPVPELENRPVEFPLRPSQKACAPCLQAR